MTEISKTESTELVLLGALCGAYGIKGWLKVRPFQDGESLLRTRKWWWRSLVGKEKLLSIEQSKRHGAFILAKVEGVDTPEIAQEMKGAICLSRKDFPSLKSGEYYWVDLIGCTVLNPQGENVGDVIRMDSNGVQDILVVRGKDGQYLIPFVDVYILDVDISRRRILADWETSWT